MRAASTTGQSGTNVVGQVLFQIRQGIAGESARLNAMLGALRNIDTHLGAAQDECGRLVEMMRAQTGLVIGQPLMATALATSAKRQELPPGAPAEPRAKHPRKVAGKDASRPGSIFFSAVAQVVGESQDGSIKVRDLATNFHKRGLIKTSGTDDSSLQGYMARWKREGLIAKAGYGVWEVTAAGKKEMERTLGQESRPDDKGTSKGSAKSPPAPPKASGKAPSPDSLPAKVLVALFDNPEGTNPSRLLALVNRGGGTVQDNALRACLSACQSKGWSKSPARGLHILTSAGIAAAREIKAVAPSLREPRNGSGEEKKDSSGEKGDGKEGDTGRAEVKPTPLPPLPSPPTPPSAPSAEEQPVAPPRPRGRDEDWSSHPSRREVPANKKCFDGDSTKGVPDVVDKDLAEALKEEGLLGKPVIYRVGSDHYTWNGTGVRIEVKAWFSGHGDLPPRTVMNEPLAFTVNGKQFEWKPTDKTLPEAVALHLMENGSLPSHRPLFSNGKRK